MSHVKHVKEQLKSMRFLHTQKNFRLILSIHYIYIRKIFFINILFPLNSSFFCLVFHKIKHWLKHSSVNEEIFYISAIQKWATTICWITEKFFNVVPLYRKLFSIDQLICLDYKLTKTWISDWSTESWSSVVKMTTRQCTKNV